LLPVIKVNEMFGIEMNSKELWDGIMIMVENQGTTACLFVDELIGQQQVVIKGLPEYVDNIHYISGCTILGDGTVSLIIDINSIAELIRNKVEA
jgi:two-component system, chemotaxis family, sensor kinase CheA